MQILVIEDEPRILSFLVRGLEGEGFTVSSAVHGMAGLERARTSPPDLVVLDLLLPGVDGLTVLRELKRERPELPVVVLSARADLPTKLRGFELGASDYVPKPFALVELIARVRAQLRQSHWAGDSNVVTVGALVLDLSRRQPPRILPAGGAPGHPGRQGARARPPARHRASRHQAVEPAD